MALTDLTFEAFLRRQAGRIEAGRPVEGTFPAIFRTASDLIYALTASEAAAETRVRALQAEVDTLKAELSGALDREKVRPRLFRLVEVTDR